MDEEWRDVDGWPYCVSNYGRVRSQDRTVSYPAVVRNGFDVAAFSRPMKGRVLQGARHEAGYLFVTLTRNGERTRRSVHSLVAEAFIGPRVGDVVRHLDGDPANNALINLAYGTFKDNENDKAAHGRTARGVLQARSKLTDADIPAIFALAAEGHGQRQIAKRFGVNQQVVWSVLHRRTWRHIAVDALALAAVAREVLRG